LQHARERAAFDILGGAPQEILGGAVTVDRDDVRVIELRRGLGRGVEVIPAGPTSARGRTFTASTRSSASRAR